MVYNKFDYGQLIDDNVTSNHCFFMKGEEFYE